jgi:hypothetical protein
MNALNNESQTESSMTSVRDLQDRSTSASLAINLSTLSTSAPAPSARVDPSVSRRGTCDRGIWTKPLAFAADAEGYINI